MTTKKEVLIVGATGMVGGHVLEYCLKSDQIDKVTVLSRRSLGVAHEKLEEIIHGDFSTYQSVDHHFENIDMGLFCIGVYTGAVKDKELKAVTVDYAKSFAQTLKERSPGSKLCFLSGQGSDRTEKSRVPFAKYKGMAENFIDGLNFTEWYSFRPGYIYPVIPRKEPNWMYKLSRNLYPLVKKMGKNMSIPSTDLAKVMVDVGLNGYSKSILENRDMRELVANS